MIFRIMLFFRFEAVDRDLHPPQTQTEIPPQPLRPAPQPCATARPRPSPLRPPCAVDYLRLRECDKNPLTPPPNLVSQKFSSATQSRFFHFQNPISPDDNGHIVSLLPPPRGPVVTATATIEPLPPPRRNGRSPFLQAQEDEELELLQHRYRVQGPTLGEQLFETNLEADCEDYNRNNGALYGSYDIIERARNLVDSIYDSRPANWSSMFDSTRSLDRSMDPRGNRHRLVGRQQEENIVTQVSYNPFLDPIMPQEMDNHKFGELR